MEPGVSIDHRVVLAELRGYGERWNHRYLRYCRYYLLDHCGHEEGTNERGGCGPHKPPK